VKIPPNPEGLRANEDGPINEVFQEDFASKEGVILTFNDGHCLCQFTAWRTFFEFADTIRQANDVDILPVMIFGTGVEYAKQQSQEIDLELDDIEKMPEHGVTIYVGISIRRRLAKYVGGVVSILYKSGKTVTGKLKEYNPDEEYGEIIKGDETIFFNAAEIRHIDAII
jgi:hypothetical protein